MPLDWENDQSDATGTNSDWFRRSGSTPSTGTGPSGDHTTGSGYYAYVEDSGSGNYPMVNLLTPCFNLSALTNPTLEFYIHSNDAQGGTNENFLSIDVVDTMGTAINDIVPPFGHIGGNWVKRTVNLNAYAGTPLRIRFRVNSTNSGNNTFTHDICIDDLRIFDLVPGNGQPPQPGLAVLDVNDSAVEVNSLPVSSGLPGPYSVDVASGGLMSIRVEGAPNQEIFLLTGALAVGSQSFAGIGQVDLANPAELTNGFLENFFYTDATGSFVFSFNLNLGVGGVIPLQAAVRTGGPTVIALSNAVVVTIN